MDLSDYENDEILASLAKRNERDRIETLLAANPYNLANDQVIRVAEALITKHSGMKFHLKLLIVLILFAHTLINTNNYNILLLFIK